MFDLRKYEYFEDVNLTLIKYSPRGKIILDVGCGSGLHGKLLRNKGNIVVGIDSAKEVKKKCKDRLNKFYQADITNRRNISNLLKEQKFDVIIFADVLEPLYDPVGITNFYKKYLASNGKIIISVPNISVWYARISLFLGEFKYQETGIFDKTHIRFFTKNNLSIYASEINMIIEKIDFTPGIVRFFVPLLKRHYKNTNPKAILNSKEYKFYLRWIYPLEYLFCKLCPSLFGFQFIVILKNKAKTI